MSRGKTFQLLDGLATWRTHLNPTSTNPRRGRGQKTHLYRATRTPPGWNDLHSPKRISDVTSCVCVCECVCAQIHTSFGKYTTQMVRFTQHRRKTAGQEDGTVSGNFFLDVCCFSFPLLFPPFVFEFKPQVVTTSPRGWRKKHERLSLSFV